MKYVLMTLMMTSVLTGSASAAFTFTEGTDAGPLPGSAVIATNPADATDLTRIEGILTTRQDVDMYKVYLPTPGTFAASASGLAIGDYLPTSYPMLFLFDDAGMLVTSDADFGSSASISGNAGWDVGLYFLAISNYNNLPVYTEGVVTGWNNGGLYQTGGYAINLTNVYGGNYTPPPPEPPEPPEPPVVPIPAPGAVVLCSLGAGLVGWLRRRGAF